MEIKLKDTEELKKMFIEAIFVMRNMRLAQQNWHEHFGSYWKIKRVTWEERADKLLDKLQATKLQVTHRTPAGEVSLTIDDSEKINIEEPVNENT